MSTRADGYNNFRALVALRRISVGTSTFEKEWRYYDSGPKDKIPLVCVHGAGGTCDIFYKQILGLCPKGYRVVSIHIPSLWTHQEWTQAFDQFLDAINCPKIHLFGVSLGGFLAQLYCQYRPGRVESMVLSNSFCDTRFFTEHSPPLKLLNYMPEFYLKKILLESFPKYSTDPDIVEAVDFMVQQLESLRQEELASRLMLNCTLNAVKDIKLPSSKITIIDTLDDVSLPRELIEQVQKKYVGAKLGYLKRGGDFPYLSKADEVNVLLQVHLRGNGMMVETIVQSPSISTRKVMIHVVQPGLRLDDDDDRDKEAESPRLAVPDLAQPDAYAISPLAPVHVVPVPAGSDHDVSDPLGLPLLVATVPHPMLGSTEAVVPPVVPPPAPAPVPALVAPVPVLVPMPTTVIPTSTVIDPAHYPLPL